MLAWWQWNILSENDGRVGENTRRYWEYSKEPFLMRRRVDSATDVVLIQSYNVKLHYKVVSDDQGMNRF